MKKFVLGIVLCGTAFFSLHRFISSQEEIKRNFITEKEKKEEARSVPPFEKFEGENILHKDQFYENALPDLLGPDFQPSGIYRVAYFIRPPHFHPFSNDPFVHTLWGFCHGSVARPSFGRSDDLTDDFADFMGETIREERADYFISLKEDLYWHNSPIPLTAHDFRFYIEALKNPYVDMPESGSLRSRYRFLEEVEVLDDKRFIVHWKFPAGESIVYDARRLTGALRPLARHLYLPSFIREEEVRESVDFARHFAENEAKYSLIGCGPYLFSRREDYLILTRNKDFPSSKEALFEAIFFIRKNTPSHAWQSFKALELDTFYLQPSQREDYQRFLQSSFYQKQKEKGLGIRELSYSAPLYYFIGWNLSNEYFASPGIRLALTKAIDRKMIIRHFLKGFGKEITGPFIDRGDYSLIPYDPEEALELFAREGWIRDPETGLLQNSSKKTFSFTLIYYAQNESAAQICDFMASSLKKIGISCKTEGLNYGECMKAYKDRTFDAFYFARSLLPSSEISRTVWHSEGETDRSGANFIGYANPEVDFLLDALQREKDPLQRKEMIRKIHGHLHADQPCTFLFVPEQLFLYRESLTNVFIPTQRSDLLSEATLEEPSVRVMFFK